MNCNHTHSTLLRADCTPTVITLPVSVSAIVGGVVGGIAGIAILGSAACSSLTRRSRGGWARR